MYAYQLQNISYKNIIHSMDCNLPKQGLIALVGRNGAGKSSLLHLLSSWYKPNQGNILMDGKDLQNYSAKERAQKIAWLGQNPNVHWELNVTEVIRLGKYAQRSLLQAENIQEIQEIGEKFGLTPLMQRRMQQLSGGQQALVHMARLFASGSPIWLVDEFDASLDLHHRVNLFHLLKQESAHRLVICAVHDLNMARKFSDYALILDQGKLCSYGQSHDVLSVGNLSNLWHMEFVEGAEGWLCPKIPL